jgi:hypothetical protein
LDGALNVGDNAAHNAQGLAFAHCDDFDFVVLVLATDKAGNFSGANIQTDNHT